LTRPFSAWKVGAAYYAPGFALAVACLCLAYQGHHWAWIGFAVFGSFGLFSLFFFRDPARVITAEAREIVSPADGTVVAVEELKETPHYHGACRRISIFLSIFSVHVNRGPMTVRQITGLIARRIVCETGVGETLAKGQKFGMIKFGSRTELYLPMNAAVSVKVKDKVAAGTSLVARFQ
jgi:phosphatidylserine decarboxylase